MPVGPRSADFWRANVSDICHIGAPRDVTRTDGITGPGGSSRQRFHQLNIRFALTSECRATVETDAPGANDAARQRLRGRPVAGMPDLVDPSRPHNTKDRVRPGEMRFRKAAFGGGLKHRLGPEIAAAGRSSNLG